MKKLLISVFLLLGLTGLSALSAAEPDLDINSPRVIAIKSSMQTRHTELAPLYASGAIGLAPNGLIAVKDASAVPLKLRGVINHLVEAENDDRNQLYAEIAKGNGHPEWENEVRQTFALRWIEKAQMGWFYQKGNAWVKK